MLVSSATQVWTAHHDRNFVMNCMAVQNYGGGCVACLFLSYFVKVEQFSIPNTKGINVGLSLKHTNNELIILLH